jgi:hypothetical protein
MPDAPQVPTKQRRKEAAVDAMKADGLIAFAAEMVSP